MDEQSLNQLYPWIETIPGKLFAALSLIAQRKQMSVFVSGQYTAVEVFHYGNEEARILKQMEIGSIDDDGVMKIFAEGWEYKRLTWWQAAIHEANLPIHFLDTPLAYAAKDAGIIEWEKYFRPSVVVQEFQLSMGHVDQEHIKKRVRETIQRVVTPLVQPEYRIQFLHGAVRLVPCTSAAETSRTEDNATYTQMLVNITQAPVQLATAYTNMQR